MTIRSGEFVQREVIRWIGVVKATGLLTDAIRHRGALVEP